MELFPKNKIIVGMAGLPGRGKVASFLVLNAYIYKTYIAKKIARYINWLGFKSEVFNICKTQFLLQLTLTGQYRRDLHGDEEFTSEFFNPDNVYPLNKQHLNCLDKIC